MRILRMVGIGVVAASVWAGQGGAGLAQGPTSTPAAPAKRPMTFADLMAMKRVGDPQISPSDRWVVFTVTDVSLVKNNKIDHLWIVPLDGSAPERHLQTSDENSATAVNGGRFSPDGKWLMYAKPMSERLWVAPFHDVDGTVGKEEVVTTFNGAHDAIWAPDSQHILFSMDVYPECESHTPLGQKRDEEELMCNLRKDREESHDPVKAQIFTTLLYRHWDSYQGPKRSHIFYMKLRRYDAPEMSAISPNPYSYPTDLTPASVIGDHVAPTFSLGGPLGYAISPDGKEVAYVTNLDAVPAASTNNDIFVLQVGAEPSTAVKVSTSPGSDDGPAYSPDGKYLAFRSQARAGYESDRFRLMVFDREKKTTRELMAKAVPKSGPLMGVPAFDLWIDEFIWADSGYLLFVAGEKGEAPLYRVNVEGTDLHRLGKALGEWSSISVARDDTVVGTLVRIDRPTEIAAVAQQDVDDTTRTFLVDFEHPVHVDLTAKARPAEETTTPSVEPRWLSRENDVILSQISLAKMESFWFTGAGETKVQGFLVRPPNFDASKKYPLKFLIHGGPQGAWGDTWSYRWNAELMAASGYVVVMVNPRGSTGYGQKFVEGVSGDWGGKPYIDLMRGLDAAEAKYPFIDKTRECALGGSYGGYMADWILTHTDRFKCIVTHDGMYDAESAYGSTEEMWFNEWEFRRSPATGAAAFDTQPAEPWRYASLPADQDPFRKWSPMRYIQNAKTPTLVIHSQKDYRLDVSQGFELFTALQRRNIPSKFLYFPDEGHWVLKPQNSQLWYETVGDWCDRWTKEAGSRE